MNRLRWLAILMGVAIIGITGFQVYWLSQNYAREKKTLAIKTEVAFRETVTHLQVSKLKLGNATWRSSDSSKVPSDFKIMIRESASGAHFRVSPKNEIVSTINVIRNKMRDSLNGTVKADMIVSMDNTTVGMVQDSIRINKEIHGPLPPDFEKKMHGPLPGDRIVQLLYGVDSLLDSIRIGEIDTAYRAELQRQKLSIPFTITRAAVANKELEPANEVTVGFAKPVTYRLNTGNTVPYLLRQIIQPILFSILLLGITILSFVLLYRSLLKQQRLGELKNEFISNITHELKTPIATVGVAIEALKNFNAIHDPARTREYLDISSNELQRLSLLVDKVLKLSMFEKKEMDLRIEPVNLEEVVQEVVSSLKLQLEKFRASVTVIPSGELTIQGDRLHLLSVVFNLLDNALKYGKENPVIAIGIREQEGAVLLTITDNGIGIPPEYKNKIFEKFFRVPHGDTHNAKGYGLGLSYVAQVVKQHKGTIEVQSQPGAGTVFTITLPKQRV
jgi:two-component system, OmpR family, phosphate regulon sensor histidine kinase PhoR